MAELKYIALDHLHPHPYNPRKDVGDVTELADSIKTNGILQNLTVIPMEQVDPDATIPLGEGHYTVLIGHRRRAAAELAGLAALPCIVVSMDAKEQMQTMLIENMQRSDLTVYEQAQGFQMMLDLGATVEEIAEKSGFSARTVRRRVKMMELDQKKLKEVSDRQLSLADFDTLAQIEDIKERNKCLDKIGTRDFDQAVASAMKKQLVKKNMPAVKKWLKSVDATAISQQDTWGNKYQHLPSVPYYIYIAKWGEGENKPPKTVKQPLFYYIDSDSLRLFVKAEKAVPEKKPPEQLAKEKAIREAWKSLNVLQSLAFDLRKQFIEKLTVTSKNRQEILLGAIYAATLEAVEYNSPDREALCKILGIENTYGSKRSAQYAAAIATLKNDDLARIVYALFGDSEKRGCTGTGSTRDFPEFKLGIELNLLYNWLAMLGYEMSTDEMALMSGAHEAYKAGETYKAGGGK